MPVAGDTVTINAGITVTVPSAYAAACSTINFTTGSGASSINLADSTASLAVSGAVTIQRNGTLANTINVGAGTFSATSVALSGTTGGARISQILISTGTATVSVNITSSGVDSRITFSGTGILNVGGDFMSGTTGTFTPSTGTVNFNGAGAQSSGAAYTFNNFTVNKSAGTLTLAGNATIGGDLTVTAGTLDLAGLTANRSSSGGTLTLANGAQLRLSGTANFPASYTTHSLGASSTVDYYSGSAQTVAVEAYGNLIFSGTTTVKTLQAGTSVAGNLSIAPSGSATASVGAGLTLTVNSLTLGGNSVVAGTWGSTTASSAANQNDTYFESTTGKLNVTTGVSATRLMVTLLGQTFTAGTGNSGGVSSQTAGTPFNLTLTAVDVLNGIDTSYSGSKTVSYTGPANAPGGATPTYTTTVSFTAGQANSVATTLVRAQSTPITATIVGLTGVASSSLTVVATAAAQVAFTTQPVNTADGVLITPAVVVTIQDVFGNTVSSTASVTLAIGSNPASGILKGTLTVNAVAGVATFSDLQIFEVGNGYTLTASSSPLAGASSSSFNITQATGDHRSVASGAWSTLATWERWNGAAWATPASVPTAANSGTILIRSPHVVTVSATAGGDQMRVEAGGQLSISNAITFTVANGTGTDLDVYGTVNNAGTMTMSGAGIFQSGAKYQHNFTTTAGTIPTATWDANSTCEIIGYTTGVTLGTSYDQIFGHFVWNCPSQGGGNCSASGNLTTINGDFTVANAGTSGSLRLTATTTFTLDVGGDLIVNGGTLIFSTGSGVPTVNVAGDVQLNGGTLQPAISTGLPILNVAGDWSNNGGSFAPGAGTVKFNNSTAAQAINGSATSQTFSNLIVAKSGQTLSVGGNTTTLAVNGNLGIAAGTLDAGTATAINLAGNWTNTGTFTSGGSTVTFGGTSAQILAGATTFNGLTVNNAAGAVFNSAVTVNGTLALNSGKVTGTGSAAIASTGTLKGTTSIYIPVTLDGIVAPGSSAGRLASRSELWNGGATYQWELTNATGTIGTSWDLLSITNGLDLQASSGTPFNLTLATLNNSSPGLAANFNNNNTSTWTIAVTTNGTVTNFVANKFLINDTQFSNDLAGGVFSVNTNNGPTNLSLTFTPNRTPVAGAATYTRNKGTSFKIQINHLLTNSTSDLDGDSRALVVAGSSTNGSTISTNGTFIFISPANHLSETISYAVRDVRSAYRTGDTVRMATNTITILVTTAGGIAMTPIVSGTIATIDFAGIPGYQYDIQRALSPAGPWTNQPPTVTAPANGLFQYVDDPVPLPSAFYRLIQH